MMISNPVINTIKERKSIRAYKDTALTEEQIETLVSIALLAPSAVNAQPWHLVTITDKETILQMESELVAELIRTGDEARRERLASRDNKTLYNTPCFFIISTTDSRNNELIDAGIMGQTICLAATSMGLGSVMIGSMRSLFDSDRSEYWRERLGFPKGYNYALGVCVGYSNMDGKEREIDKSKVSYIG